MRSYDLAIIGSGPGGYVTALYASRHNLKVCVIEKDSLGGTCLNKGCIPTKSLLDSVSIIPKLNKGAFASRGITINGYNVDFEKMMSRKDEVVLRLRAGIETLLRASKIDFIKASAKITSPDTINAGGEEIKARNIIIASGSRVAVPPNIKIDDDNVLSSDSVLSIKKVPQSIVIIGGGAIGCEFAGLFNKLGAKVTIVEMADRLIASQSREASKKLESNFKRSNIEVLTSSTVEGLDIADGVTIRISGGKGSIKAEKALVSAGRVSNVEGLGLENVGIKVHGGKISVDEHLRTDVPNIYAVGDCVSGPQLAHKASYDGMLACDNILGQAREKDYSNIPNCVWTDPEIASVGLSEEAAKAKYQDVKIAKFPFLASGKAYLEGETEGYAKIIGVPSSGEIIGVEIFGKDACNLIGEAVLAKTGGVSIKDWSRVVHGHPTLSEILQEACHVFCGAPIHSV